MKVLLHIVLCCIVAWQASGQSALSKIPQKGKSYKDFVPAGYDTLVTAKGDLNKDNLDDMVLVLYAHEGKVPDADTLPRLLLVLFKMGSSYTLAAKTDRIVGGNGGSATYPPYEYITIEKGVLAIRQMEGQSYKGDNTDKFRYQNGDFYRIGYTRNEYKTNVECGNEAVDFPGSYKDVNLLTGERHRMEISEETCKITLDKKDKIKVRRLVKMTDFKIEE